MSAALPDQVAPEARGESIKAWLEHLCVLLPPEGLAHVGAGVGTDLPAYARWGVRHVALFEADAACAKRLAEAARGHEGWVIHQQLVDQSEGEKRFFLASNPRESGLLPAESMRSIWRGLHGRGERTLPTVRLDGVLPAGAVPCNWLVVDCLPAVHILSGASELLVRCDLVLVRVALREADLPGLGASLAEATAFLARHGFVQIAVDEERVPLVGRALYVRDRQAAGAGRWIKLQQELAASASRNAELMVVQQAQAQQLAQLQGQLDVLGTEHELSRQAEAAAAKQLGLIGEAHEALAAELSAARTQLACESARALELSSGVETATAERLQLVGECNALRQSRAELAAELAQLRAHVDTLVQDHAPSGEPAQDVNARLAARLAAQEFESQTLLAQAGDECDALRRRANELEQQLAGLKATDDDQASRHLAQVERLRAEVLQLNQALATQSTLACERDGTAKQLAGDLAAGSALLGDCQQRLASAEEQWSRFDRELARAAAQIELIGDLLLRRADAALAQPSAQRSS